MSSIKNVPLIELAPSSIKDDPQIVAISEAIQPHLNAITASIPNIQIYSRIDDLPEDVLRMLAVEHRVYDLEWNLARNIEEKRELVKNSFELNKRRGTLWAIERIFEVLSLTAEVQTWWEYGGNPYHFQVSVLDLTERGISKAELDLIDKMILRYKALRDVVDGVNLVTSTQGEMHSAAAPQFNGVLEVYPAPDPLLESYGGANYGQASQLNGVLEVYPDA